jgi:phosphoribosyl 1,2-cyclic phosphodiesterase
MRILSLGSSSSGNALLVEAGPQRRTKVLIDAGLPARILSERLHQVGTQPSQLQAIFITHEHSDHIIGLLPLVKRYATPVITAPATFAAIVQSITSGWLDMDADEEVDAVQTGDLICHPTPPLIPTRGVTTFQKSGALQTDSLTPTRGVTTFQRLDAAQHVVTPLVGVRPGQSVRPEELLTASHIPLLIGSHYRVGDIQVTSFPVSHDAASPCGYLLAAGGCRVCIVTDTGEVTPTMLDMMRCADLLILESNHDLERLRRGPYPYILKQRILSPTGHLSNTQAADAVLRTWRSDSVRWLWLAHLSRTNNTPRLALQSMLTNLTAAHANLAQIHMSVLPPGMGRMWDSTQLWHEPSLWEMPERS